MTSMNDKSEIIDVNNGTHHCGNSLPLLEDGLAFASGGLINDQYPLLCGGLKNLIQMTDECHIIDTEGGMIAPTLMSPLAMAGYAVVNNSLLWISGGVYYDVSVYNFTITHASWYVHKAHCNKIKIFCHAYVNIM